MELLLKCSHMGVVVGGGDRLLERAGAQTFHLLAVTCLCCGCGVGAFSGGEEGKVDPPSSMLGELDILSIMSSSPSTSDSDPSPPSTPS